MSAANPGDTVLVLAGTYTGPNNRDLDCGGTNIVLLSASGAAATIIDCENAGRGFFFDNCEDTTMVVRGFTITRAVADSGGGAFCIIGSSPRFEHCIFYDNFASARGGGLCCRGSSPIVRNCRFEDNIANSGTFAAYGGGMACLDGSAPIITDTHFELNVAKTGGGGLFSNASSPSCERCEFVGNNLTTQGNGGGGANLTDSDGSNLEYCTFRENGTTLSIVGAGLMASSSDVTVTGCGFFDNTGGASAGAHFTFNSNGTISWCTFSGNVSGWGAACGLGCYLGSNATITNCTFSNNAGDHIWCSDASPTFEYCIFAFSETGLPVYCHQGTETPYVHHSFVFGNAVTDTLCGGNFHDIENSDPLFCNVPGGNAKLCENSPCIAGATWASQVGSEGEGCAPCGSAVKSGSWGAIKATYR
jgi:hypothetical protein